MTFLKWDLFPHSQKWALFSHFIDDETIFPISEIILPKFTNNKTSKDNDNDNIENNYENTNWIMRHNALWVICQPCVPGQFLPC